MRIEMSYSPKFISRSLTHYSPVVISESLVVGSVRLEIVPILGGDVVPKDGDVSISVRSVRKKER